MRGPGAGGVLSITEPVANIRPTSARARDLAGDVEGGGVIVLRDEGAEFEEQRRVVVTEADEVKQHFCIGGTKNLPVVVGPFAANGFGAKASGAATRERREQA